MCRFNNPLVTLPSFTTTVKKWFDAVRVAKVLSKTTKHNFFLRYSLLCVKWNHLKVWISTFPACLVVSMSATVPQRKVLFSKAPLVRLPQKHQRKRNPDSCKVEDISDAKSAISAEMFTPGIRNTI